jgi:hypothetical protein
MYPAVPPLLPKYVSYCGISVGHTVKANKDCRPWALISVPTPSEATRQPLGAFASKLTGPFGSGRDIGLPPCPDSL